MNSSQYFLDKTGMWTSALCAVHCIAVPVFVSMSAVSGIAFLHTTGVENIVVSISGLLAVTSLFPSFIKHHRRLQPIIILLFGFLFIGLSRFMLNANESVFASSGAALVASAHLLNFRICKKINRGR